MVNLVGQLWKLSVVNPPNSRARYFVWKTVTQETLMNFVCFVSSFILHRFIYTVMTSIDYIAFKFFFKHNGIGKYVKIVGSKIWRKKSILVSYGWDNNIKMEFWCQQFIWQSPMNTESNFHVPQNAGTFLRYYILWRRFSIILCPASNMAVS